jgi:hypothetical protein
MKLPLLLLFLLNVSIAMAAPVSCQNTSDGMSCNNGAHCTGSVVDGFNCDGLVSCAPAVFGDLDCDNGVYCIGSYQGYKCANGVSCATTSTGFDCDGVPPWASGK